MAGPLSEVLISDHSSLFGDAPAGHSRFMAKNNQEHRKLICNIGRNVKCNEHVTKMNSCKYNVLSCGVALSSQHAS